MKCKKCKSELDDKLLICPKCGCVVKEEKKGPHYDYSYDSMRITTAKLTEEELDPEYDLKERRKSINPVIKNKKFILINTLVFLLIIISISFCLIFFNVLNIFLSVFISLIISLVLLTSFISYECLFYKAYRNPYLGLIPFFRYIVLIRICNDEGSKIYTKRWARFLFYWLVLYLVRISWVGPFWFMYIDTFAGLLIILMIINYIKMRITVLGDLSNRFSKNKKERLFTIFFPFIQIIIYAFNKKYYYTKLKDSYL